MSDNLGYGLLNINDSTFIDWVNSYSHRYISNSSLDEHGRESDYHVTILANIEDDGENICEYLRNVIRKPLQIELGKVNKFRNDDYDVLKIEVKKTKELVELHNHLKEKFKNTEDYDEFSPHVTIAYLKKNECEDLVDDTEFEGIKLSIDLFKYSADDDNDILFQKIGKVYHKDVGYPEQFNYALKLYNLQLNKSPFRFTQHYLMNDERDANVDNFLKYLTLNVNNIFEFTTNERDEIIKVAYRYEYGNGNDICFSCSFDGYSKNIITFWFNSFIDTHKTLDTKRYNYAGKITKKLYHVTEKQNEDSILKNGFQLEYTSPVWMNDYAISFFENKDEIKPYSDEQSKKYYSIFEVTFNGNIQNSKLIHKKDDLSSKKYTENMLSKGVDAVKLNHDIIFVYNINCLSNLKLISSSNIKKKYAMNEDSKWEKNGKYWQYLNLGNYKVSVGPQFFNQKVVGWTVFIKDSTDLVLETKMGFDNIREAKQYAFNYINERINKQSLRRKKIRTIEDTVKKDMMQQNCNHDKLGEIKTNKDESSLKGYNYRECLKCGLKIYISKIQSSIKKLSRLGYGGWISPDGKYNEVQLHGHRNWIEKNRKELIGNEHSEEVLWSEGWIRVVNSDNSELFVINDLNRCKLIDNFLSRNSLIRKQIIIDCINPQKHYIISSKEYQESDFNLKSAIMHSRDIRGKKNTKLQFIDSTDLIKALKLLKSLQYHSYQYTIDNNSLIFNKLEDLNEVKKLLDNYHIGNLIKTSEKILGYDVEVDYWDFDDRQSYSFSMKDDNGNEIASLQTETYNEYKHGIFDIEVNKKYRRKGLATKLFYYAKQYLKNKSIELVHSNNLSEDGSGWKKSLSLFVTNSELAELKQFLIQYLNNKLIGCNVHEIDSIYEYAQLISWLNKNAKNEFKVISKILKI